MSRHLAGDFGQLLFDGWSPCDCKGSGDGGDGGGSRNHVSSLGENKISFKIVFQNRL